MTEDEWDSVVKVHMKGHFVPTRHAAAWWREQAKQGREVSASVVNTSSTSGLLGNPGQSNYGAAKAGIAAFTVICAQELSRYGVRVNAIAPAARTRMTESTPGLVRDRERPEGRVGIRRLGSRQRVAPRRLPRDGVVPSQRQGLLHPRWSCAAVPALDNDRRPRKPRALDRRGSRARASRDLALVDRDTGGPMSFFAKQVPSLEWDAASTS